jgi:hypothetical protein
MIKQLKKSDVALSPFTTTKAWELFNNENNDTILLESYSASVVIADTQVALEYVDYTTPTPSINTSCSIALEQQPDDRATFEEGVSGSLRNFDPASAAMNVNGSYKGLLYTQIANTFYNTYRNPLQIWGMENIDFPLSRTNRYLTDRFRVFTIPRELFGEKIMEGSVRFDDSTFDENIDIYDDGFGNLVASDHLFSKVQEVRVQTNMVLSGTSSYTCPTASL